MLVYIPYNYSNYEVTLMTFPIANAVANKLTDTKMDAKFWNQRYGEDGLAYGELPNEFLVHCIEELKDNLKLPHPLKVLCLAEGEGRNSIFLGKSFAGATIFAIDYSEVAIQKINQRASELALSIISVHADLADYDISIDGPYDLIVSIFAHFPPTLRSMLHLEVTKALAPGGYFIIEGYSPANIGRGTGGPQLEALCYSADELIAELHGLEVIQCRQEEREVNEGKYHNGVAAVCNGIFRKPC